MARAGLLNLIHRRYEGFSGSRRKLADYLMQHWDEAAFQSAAQIGSAAGVSETVVIRFASLLGYSSFPAFKSELQSIVKKRLDSVMVQRLHPAATKSTLPERIQTAFSNAIANVQRTLELNAADSFAEAAQMVLRARFIYICGMRASAGPARVLAVNLDQALGNVRYVMLDAGTMIDQLRGIQPEDLLISFSFARYSVHTEQATRFCVDRGARHLAITDDPLSPTGRQANVSLLASVTSCSFGLSHTGTLAVIDALISLVAQLGEGRVRRSLGEIEEILAEYSQSVVTDERKLCQAKEVSTGH